MSTSQQLLTTPPPEYGASLSPPELEEIDLPHVSVDVKSNENNAPPVAKSVIATTETGEANSDNNSSHVSLWDAQTKKRPALIAWCVIESVLRLLVVCITARNYSAPYTIINSLGIFLGKEYYITLVNSIWPDSDPLEATVDRPGIRIDLVWLKQGFYYVLYNLIIGISLWVVTWKDANDQDDYAKWLATTGLVACLLNITSYFVGIASMAWVYRPTDDLN
ncbi:8126_t:CDS:2 [Paraglomus brasilianum]|uniref:8126_t:CDS:1 n=1 Tax=Paraglomus brasilianum TaxID=144538 RepID=A0A9N9CUS0_9GLOM|nr:8126_t:CDS:2 [Paraglomus brasilianum]